MYRDDDEFRFDLDRYLDKCFDIEDDYQPEGDGDYWGEDDEWDEESGDE